MNLLFIIAVTYLLFYFSILIHEFGHYAIGRLFHLRPISIRIGKGNKFVTFKWFNTTFHFHSIAETGECLYLKEEINKLGSCSYLLLSLAGPLANFFVAIFILMAATNISFSNSFTTCLSPFLQLVNIGLERLILGINTQKYEFILFEVLKSNPIAFLGVTINLLKFAKNIFPFHSSDGDSILKELLRMVRGSYSTYLLTKAFIQVFSFLLILVNLWKNAPIINPHVPSRIIGYALLWLAFLLFERIQEKINFINN